MKTVLLSVARGPVPRVLPVATVRRYVMHSGGQAPALRMRGNSVKTVGRGPVPRVLPVATVRRCVVHSGGQAPALRMRGKLRRKP